MSDEGAAGMSSPPAPQGRALQRLRTPSSPCVTGEIGCGRKMVAILLFCGAECGKGDGFLSRRSAARRADVLLHGMAFLIHCHLLTSAPV